MLCSRCGSNLPENSSFCAACGCPVSRPNQGDQQSNQGYPPPNQGYPPPNQGYPPPKVKTYLVEAILVTLFCCLPFGIVSIVYAGKANSCAAVNDINGAMAAANIAKIWALVGFLCGLIGTLIYVGVGILGAMAG